MTSITKSYEEAFRRNDSEFAVLASQIPNADIVMAQGIRNRTAGLWFHGDNPENRKIVVPGDSSSLITNINTVKAATEGGGWIPQCVLLGWHSARLRELLIESHKMITAFATFQGKQEIFIDKVTLVGSSMLQEKNTEINKLKKDINESKANYDALQTAKDISDRESTEKDLTIKLLTEEKEEVCSERDTLQTTRDTLQTTLNERTQLLFIGKGQLEICHTRIEGYIKTITKMTVHSKQADTNITRLQTKLDYRNAEIVTLNAEILSLSEERSQVQENLNEKSGESDRFLELYCKEKLKGHTKDRMIRVLIILNIVFFATAAYFIISHLKNQPRRLHV